MRRKIADAWEKAKGASQEEWGPYSRDYPYDIRKVLRVFSHAADRGECVVSVLQPPADAERNQQVRTLFVYREQEADESEEGSQAGAGELPEKGYRWPLLSVAGVIGSVGGAVVLGGLAICYWRYRRLSKRQRCNDECQ